MVGMNGPKDIGSSHVQDLYMRALNGVKVPTVGYCNPVDGVKTTTGTMSATTTMTTMTVSDVTKDTTIVNQQQADAD